MKKILLTLILGITVIAGGFTIANNITEYCGPNCSCYSK